MLELELERPVDGTSLLSSDRPTVPRSMMRTRTIDDFEAQLDMATTIDRIVAVVPNGIAADDVWGTPDTRDLIGVDVGRLSVSSTPAPFELTPLNAGRDDAQSGQQHTGRGRRAGSAGRESSPAMERYGDVKVGIGFGNTLKFGTPDGLKELAVAAEGAGFESIWTVEHVIYPDGYGSTYPYDPSGKMPAAPDTPMPDPLIWLTTVAAHTSTIRLGTGILILPERNPFVLAKTLATIDVLSNGRMELGIGVGWLKEEFDALGIPWARRGARTDEYIEVMRKLWSGELISHDGEFVQCTRVASNPRPVQASITIVIGGHSEAAAKRAGRIGDGFFPGTGDLPVLIDIVRQAASDAGRDPGAIEITVGANDAMMGADPEGGAAELAAMGVDRAIIPSFLFLNDTADAVAVAVAVVAKVSA